MMATFKITIYLIYGLFVFRITRLVSFHNLGEYDTHLFIFYFAKNSKSVLFRSLD